jgi:hypothetical protein
MTSLALTSELSENDFKHARWKLLQIISKIVACNYVFSGNRALLNMQCKCRYLENKKKVYKSWRNIYGTTDLKQMECRHISALLSANCISFQYDTFLSCCWCSKRKNNFFFRKISWILTFSCHIGLWHVAQNKKKESQKSQSFTPIKQLYVIGHIWRLNDCLSLDMKNYFFNF